MFLHHLPTSFSFSLLSPFSFLKRLYWLRQLDDGANVNGGVHFYAIRYGSTVVETVFGSHVVPVTHGLVPFTRDR